MADLGLTPNGTDLGLFKISFQCILAHRINLKKKQICPALGLIRSILKQSGNPVQKLCTRQILHLQRNKVTAPCPEFMTTFENAVTHKIQFQFCEDLLEFPQFYLTMNIGRCNGLMMVFRIEIKKCVTIQIQLSTYSSVARQSLTTFCLFS